MLVLKFWQAEKLKSEMEALSRIRNALEDQLSEAERKFQELNLKSDNVSAFILM